MITTCYEKHSIKYLGCYWGCTQLWVTCHVPPKRPYLFFARFHRKTPFLPTFTQWPPIFNKLLVTERPWHIFVTQRPLIFAFNSQTSDNFPLHWIFWQIWRNVEKFLAVFGPENPIFLCISLKDPLFLCALSVKDSLFWCNLLPKDLVIWGACKWHSYVTFMSAPPPRMLPWCSMPPRINSRKPNQPHTNTETNILTLRYKKTHARL